MKKEEVTFTVAKLAKQLGYNEVCRSYYHTWRDNLRVADRNNESNALVVEPIVVADPYERCPDYELLECRNSDGEPRITAMLQTALQEWLFKEKGCMLYIQPWFFDFWRYKCIVQLADGEDFEISTDNEEERDWNVVLEKGLQQTLEKLIEYEKNKRSI